MFWYKYCHWSLKSTNTPVCSDKGLTLKTSAIHQTPRQKTCHINSCWSNLYSTNTVYLNFNFCWYLYLHDNRSRKHISQTYFFIYAILYYFIFNPWIMKLLIWHTCIYFGCVQKSVWHYHSWQHKPAKTFMFYEIVRFLQTHLNQVDQTRTARAGADFHEEYVSWNVFQSRSLQLPC